MVDVLKWPSGSHGTVLKIRWESVGIEFFTYVEFIPSSWNLRFTVFIREKQCIKMEPMVPILISNKIY